MRIGEVARRAGLNASAIRYYEAQRLLPRSSRAGGRREFDPKTVDRLRLIVAAQQFGFRLTEIREMLQATDGKEPAGGWRPWVQSKVQEIDANMRQMSRARKLLVKSLECACPDLVTCSKSCEWTQSAGRSAPGARRSVRSGRV
jgi:DNA-binding transcriptional MerR regulator